MILLRVVNLLFLLTLLGCLAGAMAGLIVFAPFVGGAWFLTLLAIAGNEPSAPARRAPRSQLAPAPTIKSRRLTEPAGRSGPARADRAPARASASFLLPPTSTSRRMFPS